MVIIEELTMKYGMTCSARAKALSDAIYQREEVVQRLAQVSEDVVIDPFTSLPRAKHG